MAYLYPRKCCNCGAQVTGSSTYCDKHKKKVLKRSKKVVGGRIIVKGGKTK